MIKLVWTLTMHIQSYCIALDLVTYFEITLALIGLSLKFLISYFCELRGFLSK